MLRFWYTKWVTLGNQRGFKLVELMLATVIIGILSAIAVPLYAKKHMITSAAHEKLTPQQPPAEREALMVEPRSTHGASWER